MRKSMTLVEILVVTAIGAILVGLILPLFLHESKSAKTPAFAPGDIVELVLDKRKAIVLRTRVLGVPPGQIEVRVAGTENPVQLYEHELKLLERHQPETTATSATGSKSPWR